VKIRPKKRVLYATIAIFALGVGDALLPSVQLGALVAVPLLAITSQIRLQVAVVVAVLVALMFGLIDYSTIFRQNVDVMTLPVDTGVLAIAFCSVVVLASMLERETQKRVHIQSDLASAVRNELAEHLRARTDSLTGLLNRRAFDEELARLSADRRGRAGGAAIIFLDLNGLKAINDAHGHHVGDEVLRVTARRITEAVRDGDVVARIGGDEFVVICGRTTSREMSVERIATEIRAAFVEPVIVDEKPFGVSASVGFAFDPEDGLDASTLMKVADQRMYADKAATKAHRVTR
jgi:diguanylate cyclase (GGDEF)-like protein